MTPKEKRAAVVAKLRTVYDPELPVNIFDLKLIYGIVIRGSSVALTMTLTTPNCPVAETLPAAAADAVRQLDWAKKVSLDLTFEPPWTPNLLDDDVRLAIGFL